MSAKGYRPDVDGLRAAAVLAVIAYHLSNDVLPGGFLGVDIFFVLSGFLITSIIWRDVAAGRFSIAAFYDRRIRRIMPALAVVLFASTIAATVILLPADLIGYGRSLLATIFFVANVYFWRDTHYFAATAEQKPLLHMWSLGVEEQFYILFPLLLIVIGRWWRRLALPIIAALTLASLALNIAAIHAGGEAPAFYLLPTRAWELGAGAALALLPSNRQWRPVVADAAAIGGAILLALGLVLAYPLIPALPQAFPVVVGTALVVLAGHGASSVVGRALALRPVVAVGLISYSLYLWHWPVLVFSRYYLVRDLNTLESAVAVVAIFACAFLSWRYVERPFRGRLIPVRRVQFSAAAAASLLCLAASAVIWQSGMPNRLSAEAGVLNAAGGTHYRCPVSDYLIFGQGRACRMNLPSGKPADADVVLLGNSHAGMYAPVWASILSERDLTGLLVAVNACLPTRTANLDARCIAEARRNLDEIAGLPRAKIVVIAFNWWQGFLVDGAGRVLDNTDNAALLAALDDVVRALNNAGKRVVLIGPIAEPGWDVPSVLSRQIAFGHSRDRDTFLPAAEFEKQFGSVIRHFEASPLVSFARPDRVQCAGARCEYVLDGRSLFSDSDHLALAELRRFRPLLEATISPSESGREPIRAPAAQAPHNARDQ